MNTAPNTHGGARPGAGRKATGRTERMTFRLRPATAAMLREYREPGEVVEEALDSWRRNQDGAQVNPQGQKLEFGDSNQASHSRLEFGDGNQDAPTQNGAEPSPAGLEIGDANQAGLPLSFLAKFASLGGKYWDDGGDGFRFDNIRLGCSRIEAQETLKWANDLEAAERAFLEYAPMAWKVWSCLRDSDPLIEDFPEYGFVEWAIKRLHAYGLIYNEGIKACGGRELVRFMQGCDPFSSRDMNEAIHEWIADALKAGRFDAAVALGAGDYAAKCPDTVIAYYRSIMDAKKAQEWWKRDRFFAEKIDPDIELAASMAFLPEMIDQAGSLEVGFMFGRPDPAKLGTFAFLWGTHRARLSEETLVRLISKFGKMREAAVLQLLDLANAREREGDYFTPYEGPTVLGGDLAILGLQPGATPEEIKRAFRSFRQKHHPDKGGDKEHFQRGERAYANLNSGTQSRWGAA